MANSVSNRIEKYSCFKSRMLCAFNLNLYLEHEN